MTTRAVEGRFWSKVDWSGGPDACWSWTAGRIKAGYGHFWHEGRTVKAHRFAYELLAGPIPDGLVLDHWRVGTDLPCIGPSCVNPAHLRPVTARENTIREGSRSITGQHAAATHCVKGHAFAGNNVRYRPGGGRDCRACQRAKEASDRDVINAHRRAAYVQDHDAILIRRRARRAARAAACGGDPARHQRTPVGGGSHDSRNLLGLT